MISIEALAINFVFYGSTATITGKLKDLLFLLLTQCRFLVQLLLAN